MSISAWRVSFRTALAPLVVCAIFANASACSPMSTTADSGDVVSADNRTVDAARTDITAIDGPAADVPANTDTPVAPDDAAMDTTTPPADTGTPMDARIDTPVAIDVRRTDTPVATDVPRTDAPLATDVSRTDTPLATDVPRADVVVGDAGPSSARQIARTLGYMGTPNGYYEYLPPGYGDGTPRPLLVFWHGIGENGNGTTELSRVLRNGPPRLINANNWPATRPFVVLSAQHAGTGCPAANEIRDFIAYAMAHYTVDPARIYLTALSCGAIGSWNYLGAHLATQVVAAVLIAGDGTNAWTRQMCNLGQIAIWGFHGDADAVVNVNLTRNPMTSLIACPAPPRRDARLTIYPGVGHDSWSRTYDLSAGHDIYAWLLSQRR